MGRKPKNHPTVKCKWEKCKGNTKKRRPWKDYCSNACRQAAYRERKKHESTSTQSTEKEQPEGTRDTGRPTLETLSVPTEPPSANGS